MNGCEEEEKAESIVEELEHLHLIDWTSSLTSVSTRIHFHVEAHLSKEVPDSADRRRLEREALDTWRRKLREQVL